MKILQNIININFLDDFQDIEKIIKNHPDATLKADIEGYMKYKNLTYDDLVIYKGQIAKGFGCNTGGSIQYQLPLPIDILVDLKLLEVIK
ncbi:hypothetical protein AN1V17_00870 [Vallitalea sediminicola]